MEDNKAIIEGIINGAFKRVRDAYSKGENKKTRLIFPNYQHTKDKDGNGKLRVSEQELRFAFVESFNEKAPQGWHYAVEVPTKGYYNFSGDEPVVAEQGKGQSGNFDLVIYGDSGDYVALIEFKANPSRGKSFKKDYLKLKNKNEGDGGQTLRYFLQIVDLSARSDRNTEISKIKRKIEVAKTVKGDQSVVYRCCDVNENEVTKEIEGNLQPTPSK